MAPKRFESQKFSLFIVKFRKLEFSAPLLSFRITSQRQVSLVSKDVYFVNITMNKNIIVT